MNLRLNPAASGLAALAIFSSIFVAACTGSNKNEPPNTVHKVVIAKIKGLDPAFADDLYSGDETSNAYESLYQYHYLKRPYTLIPNLAEAMPEISADGKTYTIKIKKGVLFQDDPAFKSTGGKGRELVAEDFIFSFKRLADPKLASTGWWVFDGRIAGLNEWREQAIKAGVTDYALPVDGLKAPNRYTLKITLVKPNAQFIYTLGMIFSAAVAKEAADHYGKELLNHPVGTGPFKLEEFNPSSRLVWVKNPTYRKELYPSDGDPGMKEAGLLEDAGQALPRTERLVVNIIIEDQPRWLNFMSGKVDYAALPKDSFDSVVTPQKELKPELIERGIRLQKVPELGVTHESFNMEDPVIGKNKYLRQALSLAYDMKQFIDLMYNGRALPAQGPVPPGLEGYDPELKNPYRVFNLAKAKELLAKAGYPEGKGLEPIDYITYSGTTQRQFNDLTERFFKDLGVKFKTSTLSWPEFQAAVRNKKGQMWGFAWGADYPDPENFLQLFYSKNASPGSNDSNYSNPEYDRMYERLTTVLDPKEKRALVKKMVSVIIEDCPWIFGVHRIFYYLHHPWLKNFYYNDIEHNWAKYLRVDAALKK